MAVACSAAVRHMAVAFSLSACGGCYQWAVWCGEGRRVLILAAEYEMCNPLSNPLNNYLH